MAMNRLFILFGKKVNTNAKKKKLSSALFIYLVLYSKPQNNVMQMGAWISISGKWTVKHKESPEVQYPNIFCSTVCHKIMLCKWRNESFISLYVIAISEQQKKHKKGQAGLRRIYQEVIGPLFDRRMNPNEAIPYMQCLHAWLYVLQAKYVQKCSGLLAWLWPDDIKDMQKKLTKPLDHIATKNLHYFFPFSYWASILAIQDILLSIFLHF